MRIFEEKTELIVELDMRIEYSNALEVENTIKEALKEHPGLHLCLDADKLTYISSAGLRVLVKLRKDLKGGMSIRNVSNDINDILETTGMNMIIPIRKKIRLISLDGCEEIGKGTSGRVYRLDEETVVKVYNGGEEMLPVIDEDQQKARQAFVRGIPTAIPFGTARIGDKYGAVFEMINVRNVNDIVQNDPAALEWIIPQYASFIRSLHEKVAYDGQLKSARELYFETVDASAHLFSEEVLARIRELLDKMPEDRHVLHGDVQLKNIMLSGGEMMMIDLDHMCAGDPVFEFASLYATYIAFNEVDPTNTERFLGLGTDICARIFHETLREYLKNFTETDISGELLAEAELKTRIAGYLRFLMILVIEKKDDRSELKERMIRHAADRLEGLVFSTEKITL